MLSPQLIKLVVLLLVYTRKNKVNYFESRFTRTHLGEMSGNAGEFIEVKNNCLSLADLLAKIITFLTKKNSRVKKNSINFREHNFRLWKKN